MQSFARSCRFVSGSDLAASTVPSGTNVASGSSFPSLSSPPQRTQTLGTVCARVQPVFCLKQRCCAVTTTTILTALLTWPSNPAILPSRQSHVLSSPHIPAATMLHTQHCGVDKFAQTVTLQPLHCLGLSSLIDMEPCLDVQGCAAIIWMWAPPSTGWSML